MLFRHREIDSFDKSIASKKNEKLIHKVEWKLDEIKEL